MIDIVYNGIKGKFMTDDEFLELQHLIQRQEELFEDLMSSFQKIS